MRLDTQKRIAARMLKCSKERIKFDVSRLEDIKEAITKRDIRSLLSDGAIVHLPKRGVSRFKARKIAVQKKKGRRVGHGSRKGRAGARLSRKDEWMNRVRLQRKVLKDLHEKKKIEPSTYHMLYAKVKGGFFRSRRHLELYIDEQKLIKNKT